MSRTNAIQRTGRFAGQPYKQPQSFYAKEYGVTVRTVKNWWAEGKPCDDRDAMGEHLSSRGRKAGEPNAPVAAAEKGADVRTFPGADAPVPDAEREAVRQELYARLEEIGWDVHLARDFARKYEPENWPSIVEQFNGILNSLEPIFDLAGIGEDFVPIAERREDLAKAVLWNWLEDVEATGQQQKEETK